MIEDKLREYDDARITTAIEASNHLDTVRSRLAHLLGSPAPRPFTLTLAGHERHAGEAPTRFVVNAMNLDDAARTLAGLPSWHEWYLADAGTPDGQGADIIYLPAQSHPGLPTRGAYVDLRDEQEAAADPATGVTRTSRARLFVPVPSSPLAPAPASPAARTSH